MSSAALERAGPLATYTPPATLAPYADEPPPSFVVELSHFSGPLDLLLTLLREEQLDIRDIPIARVAEQFLMRIATLRLDEAADYLEMAARLLRIKAHMLLPRHDGEEPWEDPRAELVRHLLEYQQVREVVDVLEGRAEARRARFARPLRAAPERPVVSASVAVALDDLLGAVDRVLRLARRPMVHTVVPRALDVAGALVAARALLQRRRHLRWDDLVGHDAEPWQILSVLLALLELARQGECIIRQRIAFEPVEITAAERAVAFDAAVDSPAAAAADGSPVSADLVRSTPDTIDDAPRPTA